MFKVSTLPLYNKNSTRGGNVVYLQRQTVAFFIKWVVRTFWSDLISFQVSPQIPLDLIWLCRFQYSKTRDLIWFIKNNFVTFCGKWQFSDNQAPSIWPWPLQWRDTLLSVIHTSWWVKCKHIACCLATTSIKQGKWAPTDRHLHTLSPWAPVGSPKKPNAFVYDTWWPTATGGQTRLLHTADTAEHPIPL